MKVVRAGVVGVIALAVLLTGCRAPGSGGPTVVTSFYPLYFLADDIAGRYNDVVDLTPPGVEPHEYELTVRQVAQVDEARVGFFEKGVAPSIDQAMANDSPEHQLDVTQRRPPALAVGRVLRGDRRRPGPALLAGPVPDGDGRPGLRGHDGGRRPRPRGVLPQAGRAPGPAAAPAGPRLRPHAGHLPGPHARGQPRRVRVPRPPLPPRRRPDRRARARLRAVAAAPPRPVHA